MAEKKVTLSGAVTKLLRLNQIRPCYQQNQPQKGPC